MLVHTWCQVSLTDAFDNQDEKSRVRIGNTSEHSRTWLSLETFGEVWGKKHRKPLFQCDAILQASLPSYELLLFVVHLDQYMASGSDQVIRFI